MQPPAPCLRGDRILSVVHVRSDDPRVWKWSPSQELVRPWVKYPPWGRTFFAGGGGFDYTRGGTRFFRCNGFGGELGSVRVVGRNTCPLYP